MRWSSACSLLRAEGFFCKLGIGKLWFLILKIFSAVNFFQFLVIKTLDPDCIRIRIGIQPKMLDPNPDQMNADPQHWLIHCKVRNQLWLQITRKKSDYRGDPSKFMKRVAFNKKIHTSERAKENKKKKTSLRPVYLCVPNTLWISFTDFL